MVWGFDPQGQFFYPRCWLHQSTGLLCPGCGATRALHALLHGDLRTAWTLNPLAVALLPVGLAYGVRAAWAWRTFKARYPHEAGLVLAFLTAAVVCEFLTSPW